MRPTLAATLVTFALVAGLGLEGSLRWIDRPFPGFLVMENGVIASAGLSEWPAVREGGIYQREIVAVDGQPFRGAEALASHVRSLRVGTPVAYRLRHAGKVEERTVATRRFTLRDFSLLHGAYLVNGILLAAAALALLRGLRSHPAAGAVVPLLGLAALWALSAMDLYGPHRLFRMHALAESLLFAAALHVALGFPRPLRGLERHPQLVLAPYWAGLCLAVAYQVRLYDPAGYVTLHLAAVGALGAALLILILSQGGRLFVASRLARRQIEIVAWGSLLALAPAVWLTIAEPWTGGSSSQNAMAFSACLFPLSIAWAVLRQPGPIAGKRRATR